MKALRFLSVVVLLLAACSSAKKVSPVLQNDEDGIVNKYWKLVVLNDQRVVMHEDQERETHLILRSNGTVSGHTGCNILNGQFALKPDNRIQFFDMKSTLRYCNEVPYESEFGNALHTAVSYYHSNDTLSLKDAAQKTTATFIAIYLK